MADEDSRSIYFRGRATARKRKQRQSEGEQSDETKKGGKKLQNKGRFGEVLHSITDTSAEITPRELLRAQPFDIQFEDSIIHSIRQS